MRTSIASVPLRRLGTPDDIAHLAMFLASPYASYISGTLFPCEGGGAVDSVKPMIEAAGKLAAEQAQNNEQRPDDSPALRHQSRGCQGEPAGYFARQPVNPSLRQL